MSILTDDEINTAWESAARSHRNDIARALEAAVLAKMREQAPVAWRYKAMFGMPWSLSDDGYYISCKRDQRYIIDPLYAAPVPAVQWQPIETAPKDGRAVLLGYFNALGNWRTLRGEWMNEDCIWEFFEDPDGVEPGWFETAVEADDTPNCWRTNPTHWMPLPAAPEAPKEKP